MTMIYLASPYTHPDAAVRQARYEAVLAELARLVAEGRRVYSPIVAQHEKCLAGLVPVEFEFYRREDRAMIDACEQVWVLRLDGWDRSAGIQEELVAASEFGKPVRFVKAEARMTNDEGSTKHE